MLEIRNKVTEQMNTFEGSICRPNTAKERIRENEDSSVGITQVKTKEKN